MKTILDNLLYVHLRTVQFCWKQVIRAIGVTYADPTFSPRDNDAVDNMFAPTRLVR